MMYVPSRSHADASVAALHDHGVRYGPELRVLIVGGGIAGLTLAALLEQRDFAPVVVERAPGSSGSEYGLGLWPAGSNILKGLGLFRRFDEVATACARYVAANEHGEVLHTYSLAHIAETYGPLMNVSRADLIGVLRHAVTDGRIRFGANVAEIQQSAAGAVATFDDGTREAFDVIVGCDGVRSSIRRLVFGDVPLAYTGLTGWAFSVASPFVPPAEVVEYWGTNKFVTIYPMRNRMSVLMAARAAANTPDPLESRAGRLRGLFAEFGGPVPWLLGELATVENVFHDDFNAVHMDRWHQGRVVLIGDAATGSLPMNAMGAALAMESAAVLSEEMCRTDSSHVTVALERFVARRRVRVDHIHGQSRRLGKVMLAGGRLMRKLRDEGVRLSPDALVLDELEGMLADRI